MEKMTYKCARCGGEFESDWTKEEALAEKQQDPSAFARVYLGLTEVERVAHKTLYLIAQEYHQRCEAYDQTVCSLRNEKGVAVPMSESERARISINAIKVREEIVYRADQMGLTREEVLEAIREYRVEFTL